MYLEGIYFYIQCIPWRMRQNLALEVINYESTKVLLFLVTQIISGEIFFMNRPNFNKWQLNIIEFVSKDTTLHNWNNHQHNVYHVKHVISSLLGGWCKYGIQTHIVHFILAPFQNRLPLSRACFGILIKTPIPYNRTMASRWAGRKNGNHVRRPYVIFF